MTRTSSTPSGAFTSASRALIRSTLWAADLGDRAAGPPLFHVEEIAGDRAWLIEDAMGDERALVGPRFARGCRCFAALAGKEIAGYGWLSSGPEWIGEIQLEIRPHAGEGYVWNCVTLPEHRRRGVFRSIVVGIGEIARREGLHRLWIGSVAIPAERAVGPAGFRPALRFETFVAGPVTRLRVRPAEDAALAVEAMEVLRLRPGTTLRRTRRRRH